MSVQTWTLRLFRIFWLSTAEESKFKATAKNPYFLVNMNGFKGQGLLLEEKSLVENMLRILCHKELN